MRSIFLMLSGNVLILGLTLFVTFASNYVLGQNKNQKPATVILNDGSTLTGNIIYRNWETTPSYFSFKKNGAGSWLKLDTSNLSLLSVDDIHTHIRFETRSVDVETTPSQSIGIFKDRKPVYIQRKVILRVLIKGKISLYSANVGRADSYYISRHDEVPFLLLNRRFEENLKIYQDQRFREQLSDSLRSCVDSAGASRAQYTAKSLTELVKHCQSNTNVFEQQSVKVKNKFGIIGGIHIPTMKYYEIAGINPPPYIILDTKTGTHIGAFADIAISKNVKKLSAYVEGAYVTLTGNKSVKFSDGFIHTYDVHLNYIKLSTLVRYTLPGQRFYFNGGVTNSLAITVKQTNSYTFYNTERTTPIYESLRRHSQGLAGGLGFLYQHSAFEFRYETATGTSPYPLRSNTFRFIYGLLSYRF